MPETKAILVIRLTRSQQMALIDVLINSLTRADGITSIEDCSTNPPTVTTVGNLLQLVAEARRSEVPA